MSDGAGGISLEAAVAELEQLFAEEAAALKRLDHARFDELTQRKLELTQALRTAVRSSSSQRDAELLERLRSAALLNQMLLMHARDTMRGILGLSRPTSARPVRLDARG